MDAWRERWARYGECWYCLAPEGEPCIDQRWNGKHPRWCWQPHPERKHTLKKRDQSVSIYRVFIARPTGADGNPVPIESSDPSYFRIEDRIPLGTLPVHFWDGDEWVRSIYPAFDSYLNDVLESGATVREALDFSELPEDIRATLG